MVLPILRVGFEGHPGTPESEELEHPRSAETDGKIRLSLSSDVQEVSKRPGVTS
jgi:hypothetical protein